MLTPRIEIEDKNLYTITPDEINTNTTGFYKVTYSSGINYEGRLINGMQCGEGKIIYPNNDFFIGHNDEIRTYKNGEMEYSNGDVYEGQLLNNLKYGKGTMKYTNGDIYVGLWKQDCRYGEGKMHHKNGDVYEGEWYDDEPCDGKIKYKNGDVYELYRAESNWTCGPPEITHMNGYVHCKYSHERIFSCERGKMQYENGNIYVGDWKRNNRHGHGRMTCRGRGRYIGEWQDDLHHGQGTMIYDGGAIYDGQWEKGLYHGNGKHTKSDGSSYEGEFSKNLYRGQGKYISKNGDIYEGNFQSDLYHGYGKMTYANGNIYDGNWKNNLHHGRGKMTFVDGTVHEGRWDRGTICDLLSEYDVGKKKLLYCGKKKIGFLIKDGKTYFKYNTKGNSEQFIELPFVVSNFNELLNICNDDITVSNEQEQDEINNIRCPVSFSTMLYPITTQCGHTFCGSVVNKFNGKCPLCRSQIDLFFPDVEILEICKRTKFVLKTTNTDIDFETLRNIKKVGDILQKAGIIQSGFDMD